jgi:hypothetical protein
MHVDIIAFRGSKVFERISDKTVTTHNFACACWSDGITHTQAALIMFFIASTLTGKAKFFFSCLFLICVLFQHQVGTMLKVCTILKKVWRVIRHFTNVHDSLKFIYFEGVHGFSVQQNNALEVCCLKVFWVVDFLFCLSKLLAAVCFPLLLLVMVFIVTYNFRVLYCVDWLLVHVVGPKRKSLWFFTLFWTLLEF